MQQLRLSLRGFPKDASEEEVVYLPSFYTHSHGYRMCLEVHPNGDGDGKGTRVSVYTCLMKGPFDDHLKWPFGGKIIIQIVSTKMETTTMLRRPFPTIMMLMLVE